ncbi:HK97 family phage major capsid protein [Sphingomonas jejuensis]|uniref:HK97 family phage major capsid protein n=1 Tax=Sphingomonas jejuensis TaxID=904715 RepID=A0ABX0XKV4_9SPHN|nr:phage major capsid protein [Sphingomonas jejuensis]NJC33870.1 HK97 family phage major capsid protein [Sphingomonas jejuensis]
MNLAVLKNEARATAKRLEDRLTTAIGENRDLTAEEETENAKDEANLARLEKQIEAAEKLNARMAKFGSATPTPSSAPAGTVPAQAAPSQIVIVGAGASRARLEDGGFTHLAEFASAVRLANPGAGQAYRVDDRLAAPTNVHMETGDAAGSYLVPPEYRQQIVDLVFGEEDPFLNLISPDPTSSNTVIGLGDETTPWGTSGIQANWRVEAERMDPSRFALTPRETKLNELYAFVLATEELLEDAPRIGTLLTTKAAAAIRWKASDAFMYGNGVGKPLGYMASQALITIAKEAGQASDTIVADNVAKMYGRVINPQQAVWLANGDIMPSLMKMKNEADQPVWHPNYAVAPGGTLLGRPVLFTEHAQTLGDVGDLQFVNPNGYEAFRKQNGVSFADSIHLYFDYNIRAFRWIFRIGGQPVLSKPVEPAHGIRTKSHFVALEERA